MILPTESYANSNKDKIYKNIYVGNINISELTKQEAIDKLTCEIYTKKEIKFLYNEAMYSLKVDDIELNYNIKETVDKAYNVGRNKSIIENTKTKINLKMVDKISFKLEPKYNTEMIDQYVQTISKELDKQPIDASIKIENENIQVINETNGLEVDKTKLKAIIVDKIEEINFKEESIPTNSIKPKYTHEKLSNINSVLGKYETKFNSNNYNRTNNIWIATSKTNNILLDSNEEFSFNQITGKRNTQQGFKEAPIIINGEMKKGVGGGICQVSSTIYNAALYSGLEITQARNHSIPSAYIQKGRDATVSYGSVDLKFKNIYKYPVLIQNKIVNNKVITTIYGNDQCKKQIDIVTEVIDV
ncbi:MAG: VanW family protein, partial [Paraclostridium sp.]